MKTAIRLMLVATGLLIAQVAVAQAPAGSTGVCKDGTYTSAPSKKGACRGHKGVKTWLASTSNMPAAATKGATAEKAARPAAAPMSAPGPSRSARTQTSTSTMAQAAGGGAGMVWVNSSTNVYHCEGSKYYGKTRAGSYMTEEQAKAKGAHADHNHPCTK